MPKGHADRPSALDQTHRPDHGGVEKGSMEWCDDSVRGQHEGHERKVREEVRDERWRRPVDGVSEQSLVWENEEEQPWQQEGVCCRGRKTDRQLIGV